MTLSLLPCGLLRGGCRHKAGMTIGMSDDVAENNF
jgi:hypothetical protein